MWNRVELKNNAKQIMRKNYWWIVLLSVITAIAIGQGIRLNVNLGTNGISTNYSKGLMASQTFCHQGTHGGRAETLRICTEQPFLLLRE